VKEFLHTLQLQRWDDHRYYHHSRINQSLHLVSALSFLVAYALLFTDPVLAALLGWLVSMTSRQAGHFFFEPKGYDEVNHATHEYKEQIKVGYNLQRKVVLMAIWAASPLLLLLEPSLFGTIEPAVTWGEFIRDVGAMWLGLAVAGLLFRTVQLVVQQDARTGLVWMTKILTDPLHDIKLYYRAPLQLLRGELNDRKVAH
jgi:type IV secretory pathway VirB3-like protein